MRTQQILQTARANQIPEDFLGRYFPESSAGYFLKDIPDLRSRVEALASLPGLHHWTGRLKDTELFIAVYPQVRFENSTPRSNLYREIAALRTEVGAIIAMTEEQVAGQDEASVFVKLPQSDSVTSICESLTRIEKIIGQLVHHGEIGGQVRLRSWESGSLWVELFLVAAAAVNVVGAAFWAAAVIRKKIIEGEAVAEHVRGLRIANDARDAVLTAQKEMIDALVQTEAANIRANYYQGEDNPEMVQRVALVIREFSDMLANGVEIHPALMAPEQVQNLFPPVENLMTLQSKIPALEDTLENDHQPANRSRSQRRK